MYQPRRVGDGQPAQIVALAELARDGKLVAYVGAGLSQAAPTDLPLGPQVAILTHARLVALLDEIPPHDETDLVSVADAVSGLPDGLEAMRRTVLKVADYKIAPPNYGHRILPLLILEGALTVMSSNWDDCIERGCIRERIHVIITADERLNTSIKALLKIHGCATRPHTMLMTSHELQNPPAWVHAEMAARLADSHVVFVGIGDVAGYVEVRIREIVAELGTSITSAS